MQDQRILLIISGGIAAYKSLELIRRLREQGATVRCILTRAATEFVTPLSVAALSAQPVYTEIFSLKDESEMGHIRLSREADLVVVAPATGDILAKMVLGIADDLATATLLATNRPVLVAPAMNVHMWHNLATQRNIAQLQKDGVTIVGPAEGPLADGEFGPGRVVEPPVLVEAIRAKLAGLAANDANAPLRGTRALVTSGPTHEAIDPVRYIANRSSGKQGHAIAAALARLGARVTLVTGPTQEPNPPGVQTVAVESASQMLAACQAALPADIAIFAAAVADWRVAEASGGKIKKGATAPSLHLVENPDILATIATAGPRRPKLVIGFAAETDALIDNARAKLARKNCDWIVANSVARGAVFGQADNLVHLVTASGVEDWPRLSKTEVAERLARRVADWMKTPGNKHAG